MRLALVPGETQLNLSVIVTAKITQISDMAKSGSKTPLPPPRAPHSYLTKRLSQITHIRRIGSHGFHG